MYYQNICGISQSIKIYLNSHGFDFSPTASAGRNLMLPDNNRIPIAVGLGFNPYMGLGIDIGYIHYFVPKADINYHNQQPWDTDTVGTIKNSADVYGIQLSWNF